MYPKNVGAPMAIEKIKILCAVLELPAKQQSIYQIGQIGSAD